MLKLEKRPRGRPRKVKVEYKDPAKNLHKFRSKLSVEEAVQILEILGSDRDPILFQAAEMTPRDLLVEHAEKDSFCIRISYWEDNEWITNSTLFRLILRRMGLRKLKKCYCKGNVVEQKRRERERKKAMDQGTTVG